MEIEDADIIRPVTSEIDVKGPSSAFQKYTIFIRFISLLIGLGSLIISGWFFSRFAENDQGVLHLLSAFGLCFGIGALIYSPLFYVATMAHKSLRRVRKSYAIITACLFSPWGVLASLFIRLGGEWIGLGLAFFVISLVMLLWAILIWKHPSLIQDKRITSI